VEDKLKLINKWLTKIGTQYTKTTNYNLISHIFVNLPKAYKGVVNTNNIVGISKCNVNKISTKLESKYKRDIKNQKVTKGVT
jgi:hypothetical protein